MDTERTRITYMTGAEPSGSRTTNRNTATEHTDHRVTSKLRHTVKTRGHRQYRCPANLGAKQRRTGDANRRSPYNHKYPQEGACTDIRTVSREIPTSPAPPSQKGPMTVQMTVNQLKRSKTSTT